MNCNAHFCVTDLEVEAIDTKSTDQLAKLAVLAEARVEFAILGLPKKVN